ncbi:MAG: TrkA family potassium uptake protein [Thermoleophilia bacterium]|nr:TrkA family potassium uptake protein [Thermoleophilia bacterium]
MSKRKKRVAVIGLGHFGWELACALASHCEVLAIDRDPELVDAVAERVHYARALDVRDETALASVLPEDLDEAVVSMGENLEGSILCTLYLKRLGVPFVRVKALSDDHAVVLRQIGADEVIFPERETAHRLAARIANPNLLDFVPLGAEYEVIEWRVPSSFDGQTLMEVKLRSRYGAYVIAVQRAESGEVEFIPGPDCRLYRDDILTVIGRRVDLDRLQELE